MLKLFWTKSHPQGSTLIHVVHQATAGAPKALALDGHIEWPQNFRQVP